MQVRITVPVLEYGPVQWTRGQIAVVPQELGKAFIERKEAIAVPSAEYATVPKPETAVIPRPASKPRPRLKSRGRA